MSAALPERFGRFRVLSELGRGAMGVVYRAEDTALGRVVAIKAVALPGDPQERDQHERRFLQEARAAGSITHPNIVTVYDVGREGDRAFMAMELVEGLELRARLGQGRVRPAEAVAIAASVAEALAHAHERGVVHRDVKPGNIMVLGDGRVKLMDFGIARLAQPTVKTQTGTLLGSPQYMSPEQILGKPVDGRSDIFSLGLVLYEMLTGIRAFTGEDIPQLTFNVCNLAAKPPSHRVASLPAVLDFIVARALKKKPEERYASAADFARDLRACAAEVAEAEARDGSQTIPATLPGAEAEVDLARTLPLSGDAQEWRPSPRFDSAAGLRRLALLPREDEESRSRAGWTGPIARPKKRAARGRFTQWAIYALALALAVLIVAACGGGAKVERLPPGAVLVAFGDSLTHGTGAGSEDSYPAQLARRIGHPVVNAGVPGETSAQGLERIEEVLDEHRPQLLIVCHGGNDFLRRLDEARAAANVRAMIGKARARNVAVVLLATPRPGLPPSVPAFYGEIAKELGVPVETAVLRSVLTDNRLKSDLVHPNGDGYRRVAEAVEGLLRASGAL